MCQAQQTVSAQWSGPLGDSQWCQGEQKPKQNEKHGQDRIFSKFLKMSQNVSNLLKSSQNVSKCLRIQKHILDDTVGIAQNFSKVLKISRNVSNHV